MLMPTRVRATTPTHLLTETIDVERPTYPLGTAGGTAPSYAAHLSGIAAAVQPSEGSEIDEYGRVHTKPRATIFVAGTHDITTKDRVVYGGRKFDITSVKNPQAAGVLLRLDCEEYRP